MINKEKQNQIVNYLNFGRYLLIRMVSFGFFILNFNWLFMNLKLGFTFGELFSLAVVICNLVIIIEQLSRLHIRKADLPFTRYFFYFEITFNTFCTLFLHSWIVKWIFPFLTKKDDFKVIAIIFILQILFSLLLLYRISRIRKKKDRYFDLIKTFEK